MGGRTTAVSWEGFVFWITQHGKEEVWSDEVRGWRMKYNLKITSNRGKSIHFHFYDSVANYEKGKYNLGYDKYWAFYCLVTDAIAALDYPDIDDFYRAFGYDSVKKCLKAFNGCQRAVKKLEKLGLSISQIYELSNYLRERYDL